jgi:hypothetical protein
LLWRENLRIIKQLTNTETKEVKTKDGVLVEKERLETLAMILGNCGERHMEQLDVKEKFTDYAERFVATLTDKEFNDFVAHHVVIELMRHL